MSTQRGIDKLLFDSAVLGAIGTMVLFFWGFAFEAFSAANQNLPRQFLRDVTVQGNVLTGGVLALFVFFPLILLICIVDQLVKRRITGRILSMSLFDKAVTGLLLLVVSIGVIFGVSRLPSRHITPQRFVVAKISVQGNLTSVYPGLYFITKRDGVYVFVDNVHADAPSIHIVREDQILELILVKRTETPVK